MFPLQGKLCRLRPWRPDDAEALAQQANDATVWNHVRDCFPHPYRLEDAVSFIRFAASKTSPEDFAIEVGGKAVGGIGLVPQGDVERFSAEVGYWIGGEYRGRGIVSEAMDMLTEYLFAQTDVVHLFATVFAFNRPSMRVLEKSGFRPVGILHRAAFKNDRFVDLHLYERVKP